MPFTDSMKRAVYIIIGTIALALGAFGLFLPVLPTSPFVILVAACYYRGSERLYTWLLGSRWFGEVIRNYQAGSTHVFGGEGAQAESQPEAEPAAPETRAEPESRRSGGRIPEFPYVSVALGLVMGPWCCG